MTSHTYTFNHFSVTTSVSECSVFIRVVNKLSFQCFEENIDIIELQLPFNCIKIYDIISKCFCNDNKNYEVIFKIKKNMLNLDFNILFDDEFDVHFNVILKEVVMKADNKMSLSFHKMEEENNKKFEVLYNRIEKLEEMVQCLSNVNIYSALGPYQPLNSLELNINYDGNYANLYNSYCKIENFYQLNKLTIMGNNGSPNINFSNKTLKILIINSTTLLSLENLNNLPSLEVIEIRSSALSNADYIIPYLHKNIKKISFFGGNGTATKEKLIPYCLKNKIELIYT
jgi:hypothetical protein